MPEAQKSPAAFEGMQRNLKPHGSPFFCVGGAVGGLLVLYCYSYFTPGPSLGAAMEFRQGRSSDFVVRRGGLPGLSDV